MTTLRSLPRQLLVLATFSVGVAFFASACGNEIPIGQLTKAQAAEARGRGVNNEDLCQVAGWYNDGACDRFCAQPDPDCAVSNCLAIPVCDQGDQEVPNEGACLQDDAACYSRSICGTTIWCTGGRAQCEAAPTCKEGERQVPTQADCPADALCYESSICGTSIWCTQDLVQCQAFPTCNEGDTQVDSQAECPQDASCYQASICGYTIWCTDATPDHCEAFPSCNEGDTQVDSQSDCPADASCYQASICGYTIWCTGSSCSGPNPAGCSSDAECGAGSSCKQDPAGGCRSSACSCSDSGWICTADCGGGICVPN